MRTIFVHRDGTTRQVDAVDPAWLVPDAPEVVWVNLDHPTDADRPLLAHVFKVTTDPFVGKLALFRVHQGKITGQSQVFIGHNKKAIKLGHVFQLQGKEHKEVPEIVTGDIGAVATSFGP